MLARIRRVFLISLSVFLLLAMTGASLAESVLTPAKLTGKATVYAKADQGSKVLGTLKKGQVLALVAVKDGWAKVELDGNTGFMNAKLLKEIKLAAYVKSNTLNIYASNSVSSKKLGVLGYGQKLNLLATSGSWARVELNGRVGFCKKTYLSMSDVNDDSYTVYAKSNDVKVYTVASTGAGVMTTVKQNTKIRVVAITGDGKWCRCKNGSQYGYILKKQLSESKVKASSTTEAASGDVVDADWWTSGIQSTFYKGKSAVVTDVKTGLSFCVVRKGGTNHADSEPQSAADTAVMKKIYGNWAWTRRAIWVSIGGVRYAASMNGYPHGDDYIADNGFDGHFCIHFTNSRTHDTDKVDADHQAAIKAALAAG